MINKQLIGKRILQVRKVFNLNQSQFAASLDISQQALSQIEKGIILPSLEVLQKLTSKYFLEYQFIIDEVESLLDKTNIHLAPHSKKSGTPIGTPIGTPLEFPLGKNRNKFKSIDVKREDVISQEGIPYYEELVATAGDITTFLQQAQPTSRINLPQVKDCDAILPVYGNSMKGIIEQGDLIAIKEIHSRNEFDPTQPYLIITEEHRMIKYLRTDAENEETIWATSTNHEPIKLFAEHLKKVFAIRCVIRFF